MANSSIGGLRCREFLRMTATYRSKGVRGERDGLCVPRQIEPEQAAAVEAETFKDQAAGSLASIHAPLFGQIRSRLGNHFGSGRAPCEPPIEPHFGIFRNASEDSRPSTQPGELPDVDQRTTRPKMRSR
jgi:hypothetical protein